MYSIGYDIGSSSVKAALVEISSGRSAGRASWPDAELAIDVPRPGFAEQSPETWWDCLRSATARLLQETGIAPSRIRCLGLAYQMHGLVLIDEQGHPLRPAIIWCDSRAAGIGRQAFVQIGPDRALHGLLNSPGNFTASRLRWVQQHEPDLYDRIHRVLLPGDYIALRLTGEARTTVAGLSEGIFWDFRRAEPARSVLDTYDIDERLLPARVPVFGSQGRLCAAAAGELGLPEGLPLTYRAGDQPNNALSLGVLEPGEVAATGGTSGVIYAVTDRLLADPLSRVNAFAHVNYRPEDPRIGLLMCINGTGIQYRWLRQLLAPGAAYDELEKKAAAVPVGAEGLSCLPFGNGAERILQDRVAGAHLCGIDFNRHGQAHLLRAGLEGIAFAFYYGMQILREMGVELSVIRAGNDNLFRSAVFSSTLATLSGCRIELYDTTGAEGAARAALVGAGYEDNPSGIGRRLRRVRQYEPSTADGPVHRAWQQWHSQLQKHLQ